MNNQNAQFVEVNIKKELKGFLKDVLIPFTALLLGVLFVYFCTVYSIWPDAKYFFNQFIQTCSDAEVVIRHNWER